MTKWAIGALLTLSLCACGQQAPDHSRDIAVMKRDIAALKEDQGRESAADPEKFEREERLRVMREEISRVLRENEDLRKDIAALRKEQLTLEAVREEIRKAQPKGPEAGTPAAEKPADAPKTDAEKKAERENVQAEARQKLADLMPRAKNGFTDRVLLAEVFRQLWRADKATRDDWVKQIEAWLAQNPDDKFARVAYAEALLTTMNDQAMAMDQGKLANRVKKEAGKVLQADPEFYEAVAFMAILKAGYPVGFPEFEEAEEALKKALELQQKMSWEARFADVYEAYAEWFLKSKRLDEAKAMADDGLSRQRDHQGLQNVKKQIEDARK